MAADCSRVYVLTPAVWWTTANDSEVAYDGAARRISSFAFHCVRVTIAGAPACASVRGGSPSSGLQTYQARTRETRPAVRTSSRFEAPVQYGTAEPPAPA